MPAGRWGRPGTAPTSGGAAEVATRPCEAAAEGVEPALGERADADPVVGAGAVDQVGERGRTAPSRLQVDVEPAVGERLEQLGHGRHRVLARGCAPRRPRSASSSASRPVLSVTRSSDVVVEGEQDAVAGRVHVGLEVLVAERHRVPEGVQRVLHARRCRGAARRRGGPSRSPSRAGRARRRGTAAGHRAPGMRRRWTSPVTRAVFTGTRRWCSANRRRDIRRRTQLLRRRSSVRDMDAPRAPSAGARWRSGLWVRSRCCRARRASGVFLDRADLGQLVEAENDWHAHGCTDTAQLPRITADMSAPPPRSRARSYLDSLFRG